MINQPNRPNFLRLRATAGDELSLLVQLTRMETIGTRMLIRNLVEIVQDDPSLIVDIVLMLTDARRDLSIVSREEYLNALAAIREADTLRVSQVLEQAVLESAKLAGYDDINLPDGVAA